MLGFTPPTTGGVQRLRTCEHGTARQTSRCASASCRSRTNCSSNSTWRTSCASSRRSIRIGTPALITRLCGEWGVDPKARIKKMSVGERQKLSILLAFGHRPDLLVLDEPVASLDPMARRQFLEQLVEALRGWRSRHHVFVAHRLGYRAAGESHLDPEGRPPRLAGRSRFAEGIHRASARCGGDSRPSHHWRCRARCRCAARPRRRPPWCATGRRKRQRALEEQAAVSMEIEALGLEEIFLELHR